MKNIWKLLMIALLAFAMIGCPATKEDDDDDNGTGGDGTPAISWWLSSDATTAETGSADAYFPWGFKFTTKAGWSGVYMASNMYPQYDKDDPDAEKPDGYAPITLGPTAKSGVTTSGTMSGPYDTVTFDSDHSNDEANYSTPLRRTDGKDKAINDSSSKIYLDESDLIPGALYTITFTPETTTPSLTLQDSGYSATVAFAKAATGATETDLATDLDNDDGTEIYISGATGNDWASDTTTGKAHRMVKNGNVYTYTYKSPDVTTTISLKLKFKDLSTDADFTYVTLTNVPVSMAGGEIEGSIFSWGGGTGAGVIAPKQGETTIVGGTLYEVTATAAENASWGTSHVTAPENGYSFANDFHTPDATGAIMLSISGVKKLVPYIKGQSKIFNWAVAKVDKAP